MFVELRSKYDTQELHGVIAQLPSQVLRALEFTTVSFTSPIKQLFVYGMGGSALPVNIVKNILDNSGETFSTNLHIVRDYALARNHDEHSGGLFISFSGNTEETLSCLEQALTEKRPNLITMATGGKLKKIAEENHITFIEIPNDCLQPRMGYGYFVGSILKLLANSSLITLDIEALKSDVTKLLEQTSTYEAAAQKLATATQNKLPVIYTSNRWKYLAMVIKINFNENAKIPAFWNAFPEQNHNEMVGFTNPQTTFKVLIFRDQLDTPAIKKRFEVFQKMFQGKLDVEIIDMPDGSAFFKAFDTLLTGLWTSYYLALLNQVDPTPVTLVEEFKKQL
jgi:glucose/mannose-6-phosphate isomerase